jgi:hypothetical protein
MSEYKESKKAGNIGEEEILKILQHKYPKSYIDDIGKANSDWDIFIPEINAGVEVKNDYKSKHTGNLVIEVEMNGKLSALSVTKAKYWVFITGYRYIWITPLEIYRFLEQHFEYGRAHFTGDGDDTPKKEHLVGHDVLVKYIHHKVDKKDGWVTMIKEDEVMYYDNFTKS